MYKFSSFILLLNLAIVFGGPERSEHFKKYMEARAVCLEKFDTLTEEELKYHAGPVEDDPLNEDKMCFVKCLKEKMGDINEDGSINIEQVRMDPHFMRLDNDKQEKAVECLTAIEKIEECSDIKKIFQCFYKRPSE